MSKRKVFNQKKKLRPTSPIGLSKSSMYTLNNSSTFSASLSPNYAMKTKKRYQDYCQKIVNLNVTTALPAPIAQKFSTMTLSSNTKCKRNINARRLEINNTIKIENNWDFYESKTKNESNLLKK